MATQRTDLDRLIRDLKALTPEEQAQVLSAVAKKNETATPLHGVTPERFRKLVGIMNVGGDAIEDTESLYDDA